MIWAASISPGRGPWTSRTRAGESSRIATGNYGVGKLRGAPEVPGSIEVVSGFDPKPVAAESLKVSDVEVASYMDLKTIAPIERKLPAFREAETICDSDSRAQVSPTSPTPWRWNCELIITLKGGVKTRGTGWLIGPRTVMTAGHCVHTGKGGDWVQSVEVIPGMDGPARPYGQQVSSDYRSIKGLDPGRESRV